LSFNKFFFNFNIIFFLNSIQADLSLNCRPAENVDDFVRQESCNLSGLKNSKSSSQFHRLPEIHRHLPLTEGPCCNSLKNMTDEQLNSCDSKQVLNNFTAEQVLVASYIDFEELSYSGKFQTSLQVSTPITVAFHGESCVSYEEAQQEAACRALIFFKCVLNNSALKSSIVNQNTKQLS